MSERFRSVVVPAYLLLCLVLGGSGQGVAGNALLQLVAIAIIGGSLLWPSPHRASGAGRPLLVTAGLAVLLVLVQLVPLPPALWTALPGRGFVERGFRLLGEPLPWMPISLAPHATLAAGLALLPPLAVLVGMLVGGAYRRSWSVAAVLLGTLASILLGVLQVTSPANTVSPWYLYKFSSFGLAVGFFSNANHMAALLLVALALLVGLVASLRRRASSARAKGAVLLLAMSGAVVLLIGVVLNRSLAVLLLGGPVVLASAAIVLGSKWRRAAAATAVAGLVAITVIYTTSLPDRLFASNATSFALRHEMWSNTIEAFGQHWALGSGVGTYPVVYPQLEDQAAVSSVYSNHAHNDYLEFALETGVPGVLLLGAFLWWWARRALSAWRGPSTNPYAQAAAIASGAILIHSFVDYPLRTAALSAVTAFCLALMAEPRTRPRASADDLWPTRHATV